jgi:aminoacyl-tRNA hydrolase
MVFFTSDFNIGLLTGFGLGVSLFLLVGYRRKNMIRALRESLLARKSALNQLNSSNGYKLLLVVRNDLKMGKGKAASQCSHAAVIAFSQSLLKHPSKVESWLSNGQKKVIVKVESKDELNKLRDLAKSKGLETSLVRDSGLTQIAPGSATVLGIGPDEESKIDSIARDLKLY